MVSKATPEVATTKFVTKWQTLRDLIGFLAILSCVAMFGFLLFYADINNHPLLNVIPSKQVNVREGLKLIVGCTDKPFELEKLQDGSFWILKNYIRAKHGKLSCGDTITYTTHGDYTFLDNLPVLLQRWQAPVSIALYAPGYDFNKTLESIQYARNCLSKSDLIQNFVTFHIYFVNNHMPDYIPDTESKALKWSYNCTKSPPYKNVSRSSMYRDSHHLMYPINVGRNIARKAAITHFILASDIELYPNPGFVDQFFEMVIRNTSLLYGDHPRVFPLVVFEVDKHAAIPETKSELQLMLLNKTAIPFHQKVCKDCHAVPNLTEWTTAKQTDKLDVFAVAERRYKFIYWEPFYVSDNQEPFFDTRVTWEGQKNKRVQVYAMCLLHYEFHVLNNAFLIHRPGIKVNKRDVVREKYVHSMNMLIQKDIIPEYQLLYGKRKFCDA